MHDERFYIQVHWCKEEGGIVHTLQSEDLLKA